MSDSKEKGEIQDTSHGLSTQASPPQSISDSEEKEESQGTSHGSSTQATPP